jgi:hypothetical protein
LWRSHGRNTAAAVELLDSDKGGRRWRGTVLHISNAFLFYIIYALAVFLLYFFFGRYTTEITHLHEHYWRPCELWQCRHSGWRRSSTCTQDIFIYIHSWIPNTSESWSRKQCKVVLHS